MRREQRVRKRTLALFFKRELTLLVIVLVLSSSPVLSSLFRAEYQHMSIHVKGLIAPLRTFPLFLGMLRDQAEICVENAGFVACTLTVVSGDCRVMLMVAATEKVGNTMK